MNRYFAAAIFATIISAIYIGAIFAVAFADMHDRARMDQQIKSSIEIPAAPTPVKQNGRIEGIPADGLDTNRLPGD